MDLSPGLLQRGQRGPRVKLLQSRLETLGYSPGAIDGVFGAQTLTAVKAFQTAFGLAPDGLVGKNSINTLNNATTDTDADLSFSEDDVDPESDEFADRYANEPPITLGDAGDAVLLLQEKLLAVGYPVDLTADFDEVTHTSVLDFQANYSLEPNGVVEASTLLALDQVIALQGPNV